MNSYQSKELLKLFTFYIVIFEVKALTCTSAIKLLDLERRSRNYKADGSHGNDPYVDDQYLTSFWYVVKNENGQYLMPDRNFKPKYGFCGGLQPIYLSGTHPKENDLSEKPSLYTACELLADTLDCINQFDVFIRKCGDEIQYHLGQTSQNAAYCFDPPSIQGITDFEEPPTNISVGVLNVIPTLRHQKHNENQNLLLPYLEFECKESSNIERHGHLYYSTYWTINGKTAFSFERKNNITSLLEEQLLQKKFSLGITMRCGVRISMSENGLQSTMVSSADFFAGIKVEKSVIECEKQKEATISFEQTVPFGCHTYINITPNHTCTHQLQMKFPEEENCFVGATNRGNFVTMQQNQQNQQNQQKCGALIKGYHFNETSSIPKKQYLSMNVSTPFLSNSDPTTYTLSLVTQSGGVHKIWKNYWLERVTIVIKDKPVTGGRCYSHVDPHMLTADGWSYNNNYYAGKFMLYHNTKYDIQVQERTISCNRNRAFCTCAVAIRAGGDVFLINMCNSLKQIMMTSCNDNGALIIQRYSDFHYEVQTNIGTLILIRIHSRHTHSSNDLLMNVDIHMAPGDFEKTRGLCGTFDNNKYNDSQDRSGIKVSTRSFVDAWRLRLTDVDYLEPKCLDNVNKWTDEGHHQYCICNCTSCNTTENKAVCSPSQYVNCTVDRDRAIELCEKHKVMCSSQQRQRRSSFSNDPHAEMRRRAALSYKIKPVAKRDRREEITNITKSDATNICNKAITNLPATTEFSELLGGFNISGIINECIFDVYEGQDMSWIEDHVSATNDAVQAGFKRNANYTLSHTKELDDFRKQYCVSNCSNNGYCSTDGICICNNGYFGPICDYKITDGPEIEDVEGGGFCDTGHGSECLCFEVQTGGLYEEFVCNRIKKRVSKNKTVEVIGHDSVNGSYNDFFTGECCFHNGRRKRSETSSDTLNFQYEVSLSNDGQHYGSPYTVHIYDSLCLTAVTDSDVEFSIKENACIINGDCYVDAETDIDDPCRKCIPSIDQHSWTNDCDWPKLKEKRQISEKTTIIVTVSVVVGVMLIITLVVVYIKKIKKPKKVACDVYFDGMDKRQAAN